jgi:hypothetical protein
VNQIGFARALPPQSTLRSGDYRVLGVLGQGGFGITYRAANERLGREVAIKEFFPATCERVGRGVSASGGLSEPDFASLKAAFLEEARVLARFELPACGARDGRLGRKRQRLHGDGAAARPDPRAST